MCASACRGHCSPRASTPKSSPRSTRRSRSRATAAPRSSTSRCPYNAQAIPVYYLVATAEASSNLARYDGVRYGFRAPEARSVGDDVRTHARRRIRTRGEAAHHARHLRAERRLLRCVLPEGAAGAHADPARLRRGVRERRRHRDADQPDPAFPLGERTGDPVQMYLVGRFHRRAPTSRACRPSPFRAALPRAGFRSACSSPAGRWTTRRCCGSRTRTNAPHHGPANARQCRSHHSRADPRPGPAAVDRHPRHAAVGALDRLRTVRPARWRSRRRRPRCRPGIRCRPTAPGDIAQRRGLARRRRQRAFPDGRCRLRRRRAGGMAPAARHHPRAPRRHAVGARDRTWRTHLHAPDARRGSITYRSTLRRELLDALNGRTVSRFVPGHLPRATAVVGPDHGADGGRVGRWTTGLVLLSGVADRNSVGRLD